MTKKTAPSVTPAPASDADAPKVATPKEVRAMVRSAVTANRAAVKGDALGKYRSSVAVFAAVSTGLVSAAGAKRGGWATQGDLAAALEVSPTDVSRLKTAGALVAAADLTHTEDPARFLRLVSYAADKRVSGLVDVADLTAERVWEVLAECVAEKAAKAAGKRAPQKTASEKTDTGEGTGEGEGEGTPAPSVPRSVDAILTAAEGLLANLPKVMTPAESARFAAFLSSLEDRAQSTTVATVESVQDNGRKRTTRKATRKAA